ncbi:glycosyltransferase family 4 protein [Limosilactobacillus fermentum]
MKILVYGLGLPPFRRGGLVNYSVDLSEQLSNYGNNVTFLYPGKISFFNEQECSFKKRTSQYRFTCFELVNPLPVSLTFGNSVNASKFYASRGKNSIRKFISEISPDIVHIHTIMGLPIEFLEVLKEKNIKIIYTTHDYYGLCPKMLKKDAVKKLRSTNCSYDCLLCKKGPNFDKIRLMQSRFYQRFKNNMFIKLIRKHQSNNYSNEIDHLILTPRQAQERYTLRKYYLKMFSMVDVFHFNSYIAEKIYKQYLPNLKGKVVTLVVKGLISSSKERHSHKVPTIGFLGGIDKKKGFDLLKQTTLQLKKSGLKFKLLCAGSDSNHLFFNYQFVENVGIISRNEINDFYKKVDLLVVPSVWHETFGVVVLEALSLNLPVLCSSMVGAQELVPSDFVFSNQKDFYNKLSSFITSVNTRQRYFDLSYTTGVDTNFANHVNEIYDVFYK